ncbi:MAG: hypothetical protein HY719_09650 [Planctomycetes bacterium]|nr:hypothetical protein [Planctomycetota bacterium]
MWKTIKAARRWTTTTFDCRGVSQMRWGAQQSVQRIAPGAVVFLTALFFSPPAPGEEKEPFTVTLTRKEDERVASFQRKLLSRCLSEVDDESQREVVLKLVERITRPWETPEVIYLPTDPEEEKQRKGLAGALAWKEWDNSVAKVVRLGNVDLLAWLATTYRTARTGSRPLAYWECSDPRPTYAVRSFAYAALALSPEKYAEFPGGPQYQMDVPARESIKYFCLGLDIQPPRMTFKHGAEREDVRSWLLKVCESQIARQDLSEADVAGWKRLKADVQAFPEVIDHRTGTAIRDPLTPDSNPGKAVSPQDSRVSGAPAAGMHGEEIALGPDDAKTTGPLVGSRSPGSADAAAPIAPDAAPPAIPEHPDGQRARPPPATGPPGETLALFAGGILLATVLVFIIWLARRGGGGHAGGSTPPPATPTPTSPPPPGTPAPPTRSG